MHLHQTIANFPLLNPVSWAFPACQQLPDSKANGTGIPRANFSDHEARNAKFLSFFQLDG